MPTIFVTTLTILSCYSSEMQFEVLQTLLSVVFTPSSILILVGSILYFRLWTTARYDRAHGRNNSRGPRNYPFIGCHIELTKNLNHIYDWTTKYVKRDPTNTIRVVRPFTSQSVICTANPANVEHMLKTHFENYPKGETLLHGLRPLLGDGIFNADGESWKSQRKIASFEFSTRTLRDFVVEIVHTETRQRLLPLLQKANSEGSVLDIQDVLMRFAFDNICVLGFGVDSACLDISLPKVEFADAFDKATNLTFFRLLIPPTFVVFLPVLRFFLGGYDTGLTEALQIVDKFALSVISKRRKELQEFQSKVDQKSKPESTKQESSSKFSKGHDDLLSRFIQVDAERNSRKPGYKKQSGEEPADGQETPELSDKYIRDMLINFVLAGRDTSSAALTWFVWLLSKHPEVEEKIRVEVASIVEAKNESFQGDRAHQKRSDRFDFDELRQMNYIQAAITESMRLYPPVPTDPKTAQADDHFPDGTFIRKGDRVVYHPYAMGRMETLWGKDCLDFKPERWLQDGKFVQESSFKFAVFQAGARMCLGKEMAYIQMKYIIASIFNSPFRLKVVPNQVIQHDLSLTLKMKHGLKVIVEKT